MATGGFIVYRYKGVKYAKRSHHDSYPEYLGVKLLCKIPKPSDEVEAADIITCDSEDELWFFYGKHEPLHNSIDEWIWEMDLDNLCFLLNGRPVCSQ
ncbi:hypothetical protein L218DRAFT_963722, partial [Marasmius fiardii PR-910]